MSRRFTVELELPDDLASVLRNEDVVGKAKEAFVMELLREHRVSQGKAAEILGIPRHDLFPLMGKYQVAVVDLSPDELQDELRKPFPQQGN